MALNFVTTKSEAPYGVWISGSTIRYYAEGGAFYDNTAEIDLLQAEFTQIGLAELALM